MAKQEKITPQEALEAIYGLTQLLEIDKLKKLIAAVNNIPKKIESEATLIAEHKNLLDRLLTEYKLASKRFSVFCKLVSSKKLWILYLFLTSVLSIGSTVIVMKNSPNEWAHRVLMAAIDMNHENPIGQYLTCRAEMSGNRRDYKLKIKVMEQDAEKILYLESILANYIDGEFYVRMYDSQKIDGLVYAAVCRYPGSDQDHIFSIHLKDDMIIKVTKRCENKKKKKDDPELIWVEITPLS